jgi:ribonucleases P/MRP protein subunit RPP40
MSKMFESYVGQWVLEAVSSKIYNIQFGGLKGKSTTHELVDLLHHWYEALDKSQHLRVLFADYSKAFDHLDHSKLIDKLVKLEVPGCLINWLRSFLTQRRERIVVKNAVSDWLSAHGGMPPSSWLGPLVFILFINDLLPSCLSYKFTDD